MSFFRMNTLIPLTDGTTTPQQIHGKLRRVDILDVTEWMNMYTYEYDEITLLKYYKNW